MQIAQVSFNKGEASPIAADRTDSAFYQNALSVFVNGFARAEGGASNRPGLQYVATCNTAIPNGSYLLPFVYSNLQAYVTEFAPGNISIYANGSPVQTGIANPYALSDLSQLRWAQSADTLNVVVSTTTPQELKRLTPTSFSFSPPTLLNGPFQDINIDGTTTVFVSGTQGTVKITASSPIFKPGHVGALFTIQEQFLDAIIPWEANKIIAPSGSGSPVGLYCRSDGKIYQCVDAAVSINAVATGNFQPVHTSGTQRDGNGVGIPNLANVAGVAWQFVSTNAGVAQITQFIDSKHVLAVVQSDKGIYSNFPPTVVGGPNIVGTSQVAFIGDGITKSFALIMPAILDGDPNNFYVLISQIFSDPTTYSISFAANTITFNTPPPNGALVTVQNVQGTLSNKDVNNLPITMTGLSLSTYWALGSFSTVQGFPAVVVYFNDRRIYAGTQLQPQTVFTSKTSNYVDFGVSNPLVDDDGITFTINARLQNPINDLIPLNDLLVGTPSTEWRITHSASVGAITPTDISLLPQNFYGQQSVPSVQTGDTVIYVQWGGRKIRDLAYQFQYDKFVGSELTVFARQMFPAGTTAVRMAFAAEPYGLLYVVRSDGVLCVCAYLPEQQVTAWSRYITQGFFEDVVVVPENGTFAVYVIVRRTINGQQVRYIERFAAREVGDTDDYFFVDSGLTYDGRVTNGTTLVLTGATTWAAGDVGTATVSSLSGWPGFSATDAAHSNAVWLNDANGNKLCRAQVTAFVSATVATVAFLDPVPLAARGIPSANWTFAKTSFSGLTNLATALISVQADSSVMPQQTVSFAGTFVLPVAAGVVHAGLGYVSQMQSMQFNIQNQPSIRNVMKIPGGLSVVVDQSAPFVAGCSFDDLTPSSQREFENWGTPTALHTGVININLPSTPSDDAVVCLQQSDPAPLTVLGWQVNFDLGDAGI